MANLEELLRKACPKTRTTVKKSALALLTNDFIGVEFELENLNTNFQQKADLSFWARHDDQSLRGSSMEFVFDGPQSGDTAIVALEQLFDAFENKSLGQHGTYRTSLHIHVNMLDLNHYEMGMVLIAAALADETLFKLTAPERKYCGFCRPSAAVVLPRAGAILVESLDMIVRNIDYRYYSINTDALTKFGTIEFRHFATPASMEETVNLVNHCLAIKEIGRKLATELPLRDKANWNNDTLYARAIELLKEHFKDAFAAQVQQAEFDELVTLGRDTREKPLKMRARKATKQETLVTATRRTMNPFITTTAGTAVEAAWFNPPNTQF